MFCGTSAPVNLRHWVHWQVPLDSGCQSLGTVMVKRMAAQRQPPLMVLARELTMVGMVMDGQTAQCGISMIVDEEAESAEAQGGR